MSAKRLITEEEVHSAVWRKIDAYLEQRLASLRGKNDFPLDPEKTARLRGRIQEVKALRGIAKGEEPPADEVGVAIED